LYGKHLDSRVVELSTDTARKGNTMHTVYKDSAREIVSFDTLSIASVYAPALANDDETGLTDDESAMLDRWERDYLKKAREACNDESAALIFNFPDSESNFTRDAVSGLLADCLDVEVYVDKARQ